jgi:hypothetical protein
MCNIFTRVGRIINIPPAVEIMQFRCPEIRSVPAGPRTSPNDLFLTSVRDLSRFPDRNGPVSFGLTIIIESIGVFIQTGVLSPV